MTQHSRFVEIAERRGFELDERRLAVLGGVAEQLLADCERLDRLPDVRLPVRYPRAEIGARPPVDENPWHGWAWRCRVDGAAGGPLAGKTVGLKDNVALAGIPLLNGSEILEGFAPAEDATIVTRVLDAGATIVGKTAVPAFCFEGAGLTGYPAPLPLNPADPSRLPGASSSGSAVLVAAGEVDLAIGGDQGGSIRIPASWCGCCGLKPTYGLVPYSGIFPVEYTLDAAGPMARTIADCAAMLDAIAGPDGLDPRQAGVRFERSSLGLERGLGGLRIGVLEEGFAIAGASEPCVDEAVTAAVDRLRDDGAAVERVSIPMHRDGVALWNMICIQGATALLLDGAAVGTNTGGHLWGDLAAFVHRALSAMPAALPDTVKATVLAADALTRERGLHYYAKARNLARVLRARYDDALRRCDVLVMPTTPMRAPPRPVDASPEELLLLTIGLESAHNVAPFNVTGHPALSVPCQPRGELPIGAMVVGRAGEDDLVLAVGRAIERAGRLLEKSA